MTNNTPKGFVSPHMLAGLPEGEPILLAFSGGADSSALLHMLAKYCQETNTPLFAAHLDHLIRKDEHLRDLEFCRESAKKNNVTFFCETRDIPKLAKETGESEELAARNARYEFFSRIMEEHSIRILATAHNADDNLETVIMNLIRGSGTRGLCGIPHARKFGSNFVVRPILGMTKAEIYDYCRKENIEYVTDSTNYLTDYSRNCIRLCVVPELKRINPEAAKTVYRSSLNLTEDESFLAKAANESGAISDNSIVLERFNALPCALKHRVLSTFCTELERVHIKELEALCLKGEENSSISLPRSVRARIQNGCLKLEADERISEKGQRAEFDLALLPGKNEISDSLLLYVSDNDTIIHKLETPVTIASDKIMGKLRARSRRPGDKILLHGMHKSVKKLMCELKIPVPLRDCIPIVYDDDGIVFIPYIGVRDGMSSKKTDKITYLYLESR